MTIKKDTFEKFIPNSYGWTDWIEQLRYRATSVDSLRSCFPRITAEELETFIQSGIRFKFAVTPYFLSLIQQKAGAPFPNDPLWMQVKLYNEESDSHSSSYDDIHVNWELTEEMPNSLIHHKYPDRAILRVADHCFAYCSYCYLTRRTLDRMSKREEPQGKRWGQAIRYLRANPAIQDVLISGGDPLLFPNSRIESMLKELREIPSIKTIRLNTRALSFNPFRIDEDLVAIFREYDLTALEVHFSHPNELTREVDQALKLLDQSSHRPLLLWRAPLLRGINSSPEVMCNLLLGLYKRRILPYYLFHYAPYTLSRQSLATSVREGVRLMNSLKRTIPGAAVPRYTLFHPSGKQEIPLEEEGTPEFQYCEKPESENRFIRFKNWRGDWVEYPDIPDNATCFHKRTRD